MVICVGHVGFQVPQVAPQVPRGPKRPKKAVFDQKSESGREGDFKSERRSQADPKGLQLEVEV